MEPIGTDVTLLSISWLCVWIVIFPLVVPASARWALVAGLAAASTWPLAYFVGRALGNPAAPLHVLLMNSLEAYVAAALAMFSTIVIRRLQELGCYQLVEKLDHGGMGQIWRARHRLLARPVAVKLIRPELLGVKSPVEAASLVARFQREAEATAALHSSHTVALHDFGVTPEGAFYYVMELLDGLDLETLVRRFGPVPPERAIHILIHACDSLAEAHATGLVHRDVKPANILTLDGEGVSVRLLDFGLAQLEGADTLTAAGDVPGTLAYIAPERLSGAEATGAADVWAVGVILWEALAGYQPFFTASPIETARLIGAGAPPLASVRPDLPRRLVQAVDRALSLDPRRRPEPRRLAAELQASLAAAAARRSPCLASAARRGRRTVSSATSDMANMPLIRIRQNSRRISMDSPCLFRQRLEGAAQPRPRTTSTVTSSEQATAAATCASSPARWPPARSTSRSSATRSSRTRRSSGGSSPSRASVPTQPPTSCRWASAATPASSSTPGRARSTPGSPAGSR